MVDPKVWTFFYGSSMNRAVLREVDLVPDRFEVAKLTGFDLRIAPRANLVPSEQPARELGFPEWYIAHLESFRS